MTPPVSRLVTPRINFPIFWENCFDGSEAHLPSTCVLAEAIIRVSIGLTLAAHNVSMVSVQQLTKIYGTQRAVDAISFEARPGQILGFLGPNGAGKTTTMKVVTCFLPPTEGEVSVAGYSVRTHPMEVRRRIGYLPEHNPLYGDMYVREYLRFVAGLNKVPKPKQRIDEMIERTGLELEQHKPIGALSKGYRQRVGLAQAMLHDPKVLILDEPTSGLDPNQLADIRALIKALGREKTVIFSTHIMQEVQALCDRVLIIKRGRIVADDPIDQLAARVGGETVITIELAKEAASAALRNIPGVKRVEALGQQRYALTSAADVDPRAAIFRWAVQQQQVLLGMERATVSVEDVFTRLTKTP